MDTSNARGPDYQSNWAAAAASWRPRLEATRRGGRESGRPGDGVCGLLAGAWRLGKEEEEERVVQFGGRNLRRLTPSLIVANSAPRQKSARIIIFPPLLPLGYRLCRFLRLRLSFRPPARSPTCPPVGGAREKWRKLSLIPAPGTGRHSPVGTEIIRGPPKRSGQFSPLGRGSFASHEQSERAAAAARRQRESSCGGARRKGGIWATTSKISGWRLLFVVGVILARGRGTKLWPAIVQVAQIDILPRAPPSSSGKEDALLPPPPPSFPLAIQSNYTPHEMSEILGRQ